MSNSYEEYVNNLVFYAMETLGKQCYFTSDKKMWSSHFHKEKLTNKEVEFDIYERLVGFGLFTITIQFSSGKGITLNEIELGQALFFQYYSSGEKRFCFENVDKTPYKTITINPKFIEFAEIEKVK